MAKLASLVVDLEVRTAALQKGLEQANKKLDSFGMKANNLGDLIKGAFAFAVIQQGLSQLAGFVAAGTKALAEEEKSVGRLSAAFTALGYDAQKLTPYFNELASQLEEDTLVSGETIRQVQQLMVQFGVAPSAIHNVTKAVLDYSAASGKDAVSATTQLLSAVTSGKDEIAKMGISFETTGDKTKDLTAAAEALEKKFGGTAKGATAGLAGELGRLHKATDDLSKAMAGFLSRTGISGAVMNTLTSAFEGMAYALGEEHEAAKEAEARTNRLTAARERLMKAESDLKTLESERQRLGAGWAKHMDARLARQRALVAEIHMEIAASQAAIAAANQRHVQEAQNMREAAETGQSAEAAALEAQEREKKALEEQEKAAKAAAKAMEKYHKELADAAQKHAEQLKRVLELSRATDAISRGSDTARQQMAQAQSGQTADPRSGFSEFEEALVRSEVALIQEAELRHKAGELERQGLMTEADAALRAANAHRELADRASAAVDAFINAEIEFQAAAREHAEQLRRAIEDAQAAFVGRAQQLVMSGSLGNVAAGAMNGAQAGMAMGPHGAAAGAAAGALMELVAQSSQYAQIQESLNGMMQVLADTVGRVLEPLMPIIELMSIWIEFLAPLGVLFELLAIPLALVFEVLKTFYIGVGNIILGFSNMWNGILDLLSKIPGLNELREDFGIDTSGMEDSLERLSRRTYDAADATEEAADATVELGEAARTATEEILNAPAGFKGLALARYNAADMDEGPGGGAGGSGAGETDLTPTAEEDPVVEVHVNADLRRYVRVEARQGNYARTGSTQPRSLTYDY